MVKTTQKNTTTLESLNKQDLYELRDITECYVRAHLGQWNSAIEITHSKKFEVIQECKPLVDKAQMLLMNLGNESISHSVNSPALSEDVKKMRDLYMVLNQYIMYGEDEADFLSRPVPTRWAQEAVLPIVVPAEKDGGYKGEWSLSMSEAHKKALPEATEFYHRIKSGDLLVLATVNENTNRDVALKDHDREEALALLSEASSKVGFNPASTQEEQDSIAPNKMM